MKIASIKKLSEEHRLRVFEKKGVEENIWAQEG